MKNKNILLLLLLCSGGASANNKPLVSDQQMLASLFITSGNNEVLADGIRMRYNTGYLTAITDDIIKLDNPGENISSWRENKELIIEKRPWIPQHDTTFLRLTNLHNADYCIKFYTINFIQSNVIAYIHDSWLMTSTPINVTGDTTRFNFKITADSASSASDRFMIVYAQSSPLILTFTSVSASQQQRGGNMIEWKVNDEADIQRYEVERSSDGANFITKAVIIATIAGTYNWIDVNPVVGYNFYRVRGMGMNISDGVVSNVVRVNNSNGYISIYPNQIANGGSIYFQFTNINKGTYKIIFINTSGQPLFSQYITHLGGSSYQTVPINNVAAGYYLLEIISPDNTNTMKKILIK